NGLECPLQYLCRTVGRQCDQSYQIIDPYRIWKKGKNEHHNARKILKPNVYHCKNSYKIVVQYSDDESGDKKSLVLLELVTIYIIVSYRTPSTPKRKKIELTCEMTNPKIHRFSDLILRNFETLNSGARNFKVIKTIVSQLRRKNKNLEQKCKRLKKKVETLNDLWRFLRRNH
ncbi:Uncharacterized protein FWK35_00009908, partial [Aphis craccivora]